MDHDVAQLLELLMGVAFRTGAVRVRSSPREPALRKARVCYDHLAGEVAVAAYEGLVLRGVLSVSEGGLQLTEQGAAWFESFGVDVASASAQRRALCRPCMDWGERRHHLGGALGAALLQRLFELGWARRVKDSRVVSFTPKGEQGLGAWSEVLR